VPWWPAGGTTATAGSGPGGRRRWSTASSATTAQRPPAPSAWPERNRGRAVLDRVLIAARGDGEAVRRRIAALAEWYGVPADVRAVAGGAVSVAALGAPLRQAAFGEAPPATLDVLGADDRALRRYEGGGAALAATSDRARLVAGAGAPALIYAASAADGSVQAWSTHAVAASYVATGAAAVDPSAVPEQLAAEFVGDGRSLVTGVRALRAASLVDLTATRAEEGCYWPARDRWRLVPPQDAHAYTEHHLLRSLDERLAGVARPFAGLTAGYDSRAAALALRDLGKPFVGYTWGPDDDEDVRGGAEAAAAVGMEHRRLEFEQWEGADAVRRTRANARWTEGAIHVGFAGIVWPPEMRAFVNGAGGETGRCFYYSGQALDPPPGDLALVVSGPLADRIAGARPEAIEALHARVRDWVSEAGRTGVDGWRLLDVVYAEQRVRRWLRGMLPRLPAAMVGAFTSPEVQRGLISLPIEERARSGFHRRFIADRVPELLPTSEPEAAAGGRRPLARVAQRLRRGRLDGDWAARPEYRDWIADGVLGSALAVEAMGERWCRRTRSRFYAGDAFAMGRALWLGGPVALSEALAELARD